MYSNLVEICVFVDAFSLFIYKHISMKIVHMRQLVTAT